MRSLWQLAAVSLTIAAAGCARLPGRESLPKLGLPSPHATIAAAQKKQTAAKTAASPRTSSKKAESAAAKGELQAALTQGRNFERLGEYDKARRVYESALRQRPNDPQVLQRLGVVADQQQKHTEAEKLFAQALRQSPRDAELHGDLGYCYFLQGKLERAKAELTKAVELAPSVPRHRNNLGLVLGHLKDYDAAFEHFSAAGSQADAFYNMAFVFAAQDLIEEAKGCFQEAIAADPSHERARQALAAFEEYDRTPAHRRDSELAAGDVRYVPYIEGSSPSGHGDGDVQQASTSSLPASKDVGRASRTLQLQSRGLLGRHMQQQRQPTSETAAGTGGLIEVQPQ